MDGVADGYTLVFERVCGVENGGMAFEMAFENKINGKFYQKNLPFTKNLPTFAFANRRNGAIAQLVEHRTENPCVPGSNPGGTTKYPDSVRGIVVK